MLRLLFLLLVVLGALAVTLGLIFGVGVARRANTIQNSPVASTPTAPATQRVAPATTPFTGAAPTSAPSTPPIAAAPAAPDAARVIVLSPRDVELKGDEIQIERDDVPTIGAWRRVQDYVVWRTAAPAKGVYRIDLLYACENGNGGEFVLKAGSSKFVAETIGTGGWGNFKWVTIGTAKFSTKQSTLAIKPSELLSGRSLMRLREVRLVLLSDPK